MPRVMAAKIGFDACMFMLHETFGAPKGGGGPAVGAYGCSAALERFLPGPLIANDGGTLSLIEGGEENVGRAREYLGNIPVIVKAYSWIRAMGADGIREAANLSVLANNYTEHRLERIDGVTKAFPAVGIPSLEMTRYSLAELTEETGVTAVDVQNRMVDFGVDAFWLSHEPWSVPEPFTLGAGEMWSVEDLDYWISVLEYICQEARSAPDVIRSAPHSQAVHRLDTALLNDPEHWATTWRTYQRKRGHPAQKGIR